MNNEKLSIPKNRINSIDILRGSVIFWMVVFQTLDIFSRDFIIYTDFGMNFGMDAFNWVSTFMFVVGIGLFISISKRLEKKDSRLKIFFHFIKRYSVYILLSFLICIWVSSFEEFLRFGEILGAAGLYAIITSGLLLLFYKHKTVLVFTVIAFSLFLREIVSNFGTVLGIPCLCPFFYGFTIWNILPFIFAGIFLAGFVIRRESKKIFFFAISLIPFISWIFLTNQKVSYMEGTIGFVVLNLFVNCMLLLAVMRVENNRFLSKIAFIGRHPLLFYFSQVTVFFKLSTWLGVFKSLDLVQGLIVTMLLFSMLSLIALFEEKTLIINRIYGLFSIKNIKKELKFKRRH